LNNFILITI